MKFTKEDALKELEARMTANGEKLNLSQRSINEQLETLIPLIASDETEIADFIDKTLPLFKTADANVRNDVSVGISEFKKNYKPADDKKTDVVVDDKKDDVTDPTIAALLKRLSDLEDESKAAKERALISDKKKSFLAKVKELGVEDEEWVSDYADVVTFNSELDVDTMAETCLKFYNKTKSTINEVVTPKRGGGGSNDKYVESILSSVAESFKV